jgi:aspartyl-tRNA(Asn)/glutamyl-tRNA(Gln) amidotransferase subunit A
MEPFQLGLAEGAEAIARKELSASELLESVLERIAAVDPRVGAFVNVTEASARQAAATADTEIHQTGPRSPLHGIPVSLKDLYDVEGLPTGAGSRARDGHLAERDSVVAQRLSAGGAVLLGKVHCHEFAYGATTPATRNPWALGHIAGGSSGGSAAAVAAGMGMASMGTDTGGSIRCPAAECGIVGLKPTYGRIPLAGVVPLSWSLDHAGPLTRSVRDTALLTAAIAGHHPDDSSSSDRPVPDLLADLEHGVEGLTIGVPANLFFDHCHPDVEAAVQAAIGALAAQGARPVEVTVPMAEQTVAAHFVIMAAEASAYHRSGLERFPELYGPDIAESLRAGEAIPATDYIDAIRTRTLVLRAWRDLFAGIDVLIAPTLPIPAPVHGAEMVEYPDGTQESIHGAHFRNAFPADYTGYPALSVPCGFTRDILPIGLQVIGRPYQEATVLRVGRCYEAIAAWPCLAPDL